MVKMLTALWTYLNVKKLANKIDSNKGLPYCCFYAFYWLPMTQWLLNFCLVFTMQVIFLNTTRPICREMVSRLNVCQVFPLQLHLNCSCSFWLYKNIAILIKLRILHFDGRIVLCCLTILCTLFKLHLVICHWFGSLAMPFIFRENLFPPALEDIWKLLFFVWIYISRVTRSPGFSKSILVLYTVQDCS